MLGFFRSPEQRNSTHGEQRPSRKRARQATETNKHNASLRSSLRTAVKQVRKSIQAGAKAAAMRRCRPSQAVIDRIATKDRAQEPASRTQSRSPSDQGDG